MKIALVSYDVFQDATVGLYPPIHLCTLATSLVLAGYEVRVFDYCGPFTEIEDYFMEVGDYAPDIVGMTSYTPYIGTLHKHTKILRRHVPNAVMIVGGSHPTVWPEWTLKNMPQFDYAMQGEADRSVVDFAGMISGKKQEQDVPGLVYRKGKDVTVNKRDTIKDLNELPQTDRSFLDRYYERRMYWHMAARGALDMMISSRGCPYDCSFCFKLEKKYRFRNVDHLMVEFEALRKRGIKSVHIQDDAFTANRKRCIEVADALVKGRYKFDIKVRSRVNSINEEILRKLKAAGVKQIIYGFESGSQKMLDSMNKRTTVELNRRAVDLTKKVGIGCYGDLMIGIPGETRETIDETISFLLEKKPIIGSVPVLYPLPSTPVYEEAKRNGTLQGDWDTEGTQPWVKLPWTESYRDLTHESRRISRTVQKDLGTILYFLRHHLRTMSWRQVKFLARLARQRLRSKRSLHC